MGKKRGPKADYATYNGEIIEGLYCQKYKDGRVKNYYYYDANGKRISCTSDVIIAVQRFEAYKHSQDIDVPITKTTEIEITIPKDIDSGERFGEQISQTLEHLADGQVTVSEAKIDDNEFWALAEKKIKQNLPYAAKRLGIPQLTHLEGIAPIPKSTTLDDAWNKYINAKKKRSKRYMIEAKRYFDEFKSAINKSRIREITYDDIDAYNDLIHQKTEGLSNPSATISNKYGIVVAVIRYAKKKAKYKKDLIELLESLEQLDYLKTQGGHFVPIEPSEFHSLLEHCEKDLLMKSCILLGLNCALRWTGLIHLKKQHIDFSNKTLKAIRHKTRDQNIVLASCLWDETVEAIQKYLKSKNNNTQHLFITKYGLPYKNSEDLRKRFNKVRDRAKLSHLTHPLLRKTFATTSTLMGYGSTTDAYKTVMGRKIQGSDNEYIAKLPQATSDVVNAVRKHFFEDENTE
jgi:integrase